MGGIGVAEAQRVKIIREAEIERDLDAALADAKARLIARGFRQTDPFGMQYTRGKRGIFLIAFDPLIYHAVVIISAESTSIGAKIRLAAEVETLGEWYTKMERKAWEADLDSVLVAAAGSEPTDLAQRIGRGQAIKNAVMIAIILIVLA